MTCESSLDMPPSESPALWRWAPYTCYLGTSFPSLHLLFSLKEICMAGAFSWVSHSNVTSNVCPTSPSPNYSL